jgi:PAS domain-containing protein
MAWSAIAEPATGLMYAVADITELVKLESEQKKTIDALYQNEEKLRLENISEGIIVANADKKIILANYIANEMLEFRGR